MPLRSYVVGILQASTLRHASPDINTALGQASLASFDPHPSIDALLFTSLICSSAGTNSTDSTHTSTSETPLVNPSPTPTFETSATLVIQRAARHQLERLRSRGHVEDAINTIHLRQIEKLGTINSKSVAKYFASLDDSEAELTRASRCARKYLASHSTPLEHTLHSRLLDALDSDITAAILKPRAEDSEGSVTNSGGSDTDSSEDLSLIHI